MKSKVFWLSPLAWASVRASPRTSPALTSRPTCAE